MCVCVREKAALLEVRLLLPPTLASRSGAVCRAYLSAVESSPPPALFPLSVCVCVRACACLGCSRRDVSPSTTRVGPPVCCCLQSLPFCSGPAAPPCIVPSVCLSVCRGMMPLARLPACADRGVPTPPPPLAVLVAVAAGRLPGALILARHHRCQIRVSSCAASPCVVLRCRCPESVRAARSGGPRRPRPHP